jgi:uncharacterized protein Usg
MTQPLSGDFEPGSSEMSDLEQRLRGASLLTTEILYYRPDSPKLLQTFAWQTLDTAPTFPRLAKFLDFWRREIEATIHSIRIAHSGLVRPTDVRIIDGVLRLH